MQLYKQMVNKRIVLFLNFYFIAVVGRSALAQHCLHRHCSNCYTTQTIINNRIMDYLLNGYHLLNDTVIINYCSLLLVLLHPRYFIIWLGMQLIQQYFNSWEFVINFKMNFSLFTFFPRHLPFFLLSVALVLPGTTIKSEKSNTNKVKWIKPKKNSMPLKSFRME